MAIQRDNPPAQSLKEPYAAQTGSIIPYPTSGSDLVSRFLLAGLLTGIIDGLFSSVLSVAFYDSTVPRLFKGVAAVLLGGDAVNGGASIVAIGILMHFGVAFGWSAVFLFLIMRWSKVRAVLASPYGAVKIAALYGPFIWMFMSLVVISILLHRPPTITNRWWIQFIGHFPFVGLPIVASSAKTFSKAQD
jgi:hypothetical protein